MSVENHPQPKPPSEHPGQGPQGPLVRVEDLNTNEEESFHMPWTATLQQVWDQAYIELGEARRERDVLECHDGTSLMDYLSLTLEQLRDQHICPNRHFQIRGGTGGA